MKNIHIIIISLFVLAVSTGCNDWLDVNENPNNLNKLPEPDAALAVAQINIANALMGWDLGIGGAFWSQYWTQRAGGQDLKFLDTYENATFEIAHRNLISSALVDLKEIKKYSSSTELVYFIAEALSIYTWQIVTDTWGDVPYFEALRGDEGITSPKFDSQQSIYTDLLKRVDALLVYTSADNTTMSPANDLIYGANFDHWYSFAKTIKLKLMMRLSATSGYDNAQVLTLINQGGFIDSMAMIYRNVWTFGEHGKQYPLIEYQVLSAGRIQSNVVASATFIEWLQYVNDPRIDNYFRPTTSGHKGMLQGDYTYTPTSTDFSMVITDSVNTDIPLISRWEVEFWKAEAFARSGNSTKAKEHYITGVTQSLNYWGNNTAGLTFMHKIDSIWDSASSYDHYLEQIALQKWTAYYKLQHWESFMERNRIKYPKVNMIDVANNRSSLTTDFPVGNFVLSVAGRATLQEKLPSSPLYPVGEITRNANAPGNKTNIGVDVWWNAKTENQVQP